MFHKEPTNSSCFITKSSWKKVHAEKPRLLLCHAREASKGSGLPCNNKNNHPFVSDDLSIAAIHNGRIPDEIYLSLKKQYFTKSDCDSELFLRMFETDKEVENYENNRFNTLKYIWNSLDGSQMAVVIGEHLKSESRIWIFRNQFRSLYKVNVPELNQIFFVSTKEIWEDSILDIKIDYFIEEFDINKIYFFEVNSAGLSQQKIDI